MNEDHQIHYKCDVAECKNISDKKPWKRFSTLRKHYVKMMNDESQKNTKFLEIFKFKKCLNFDELLGETNANNICIKCIGKHQIDDFNNLANPIINQVDRNVRWEQTSRTVLVGASATVT